MLISIKDVQVAQMRCEEFHRHAAEDVFASRMMTDGRKRTVADRFAGVRTQTINWARCQLIAWRERLQTGFTPRHV